MKLLRNLIAAIVAACCLVSSASAYTMRFYLEVNDLAGTWWLGGSTDAPGGIAAFVVDLVNPGTGNSVAPRSESLGSPIRGFTIGNEFKGLQAFAALNITAPQSLVYALGYQDVPDAEFGPLVPGVVEMRGSGIRNVGGYIRLYEGAFTVGGNLPNFSPNPTSAAGNVFSAPGVPFPVVGSGQNLTFTYERVIVPEPAAISLAALCVPILIFVVCQRRCRAAYCTW